MNVMRLAEHILRLALLPALLAVVTASSRAQSTHEAPLFEDDAPLELTIAMDFEAVLSDREEERDDQPAMLYETGGASETGHGIGLRTRGFYRLRYLDCDVPPLRLNFRKSEVDGTVFQGQDKLKLVTHCKNRSDRFQQYVFQEYLIYRAYNLLTDLSFRTRLARVTYVDTRGRDEPVTGYGFLIEDEDRLAERHGATVIGDEVRIMPGATEQDAMSLLAVFQYMIGNTDWTVSTHHNVRLIFVDSTRIIQPVPYDFDWSGLINTSYAIPFEVLGTRSVRERRFMGLCRSEPEFEAIFQRFLEVEDDVLALFRDSVYLERRTSARSVAYLEEFFETLGNPARTRREFADACL